MNDIHCNERTCRPSVSSSVSIVSASFFSAAGPSTGVAAEGEAGEAGEASVEVVSQSPHVFLHFSPNVRHCSSFIKMRHECFPSSPESTSSGYMSSHSSKHSPPLPPPLPLPLLVPLLVPLPLRACWGGRSGAGGGGSGVWGTGGIVSHWPHVLRHDSLISEHPLYFFWCRQDRPYLLSTCSG